MVTTAWLSVALLHLLVFIALTSAHSIYKLLREGPDEGSTFYATRYDDRPKRRGPRCGGGGPIDKDHAYGLVFRRKRTVSLVWHWLASLGVPPWDRLDKTQDVLISAHQSWHTYDPKRAPPWRWLNQIVVHVASHYREQAKHRREVLAEDEGVLPEGLPDQGP